jgi:hypothetical protein
MLKKMLHGLVPAICAGLATLVPGLGIPLAVKVALGGFLGYMVKPARPAQQEDSEP